MPSSSSPASSSSEEEDEDQFFTAQSSPLYSSDEDLSDEMRGGGSRHATHRLTPLRTRAEVEKSSEQVNVYVCEIPVKATGEIIEALKHIAAQDSSMQHLRRVAKHKNQPDILASNSSPGEGKLWILLCPVEALSLEDMTLLLSGTSVFGESAATVLTIPVPRHPPLSAKHANQLSKKFWPTVYTSTNPFGPHPTIVTKSTTALEKNGNVDRWMKLAHDIARQSHKSGKGAPIGTVVVERLKNGTEHVVCVAGDARYGTNAQHGPAGNPAAHSVLRAIAMVADKRLAMASMSPALHTPAQDIPAFQGSMTGTEAKYFTSSDTLSPNGYLCLDLLVFTTHEPCLMCSMALVHSRVGGVVFRRAIKETGGMLSERSTRRQCGHKKFTHPAEPKNGSLDPRGISTAEGLKYGMFWREDLNWRFLAWQWDSTHGMFDFDKSSQIPYDLHA
ncbi:MAG: hypothetical protein Q9159_004179 [Coniocarpon cinnabarinum]